MDVICINRYYGWYQDQGHPEAITMGLSYELSLWYAKHGKPMMITEYGAGTIAGFHKVCVRLYDHTTPTSLSHTSAHTSMDILCFYDAISLIFQDPPVMFTEDFQVSLNP